MFTLLVEQAGSGADDLETVWLQEQQATEKREIVFFGESRMVV